MEYLREKVLKTRKEVQRDTLDLDNKIRADIMNSTRLAVSVELTKYPEKHEIYVNACFLDGTIENWSYKLKLEAFELVIEKDYIGKWTPRTGMMGDDDDEFKVTFTEEPKTVKFYSNDYTENGIPQ